LPTQELASEVEAAIDLMHRVHPDISQPADLDLDARLLVANG
jgi:hypothetical protein